MILNFNPIVNLQTRNINASTAIITYSPSAGYDAHYSITLSKVTAAIDNNIQSTNIKQGIVILGITGTLQAQSCPTCQTCDYCQWCDYQEGCISCEDCDNCQYCNYCQYCNICQGCYSGCDTCQSNDCGDCESCEACVYYCEYCDTCDDCESCDSGEGCGEDGWQESCGECACNH